MDLELQCVGATSVPDITGTVVDACTTAGGVVVWGEPMSAIPGLTLDGASDIAAAVLLLWATAWAFRALYRVIKES